MGILEGLQVSWFIAAFYINDFSVDDTWTQYNDRLSE